MIFEAIFGLMMAVSPNVSATEASYIPVLKTEIEEESRLRISPKFQLTLGAEGSGEKGIQFLKGIYAANQNINAVEATLVTPTGDTAYLRLPELSIETLTQGRVGLLNAYLKEDSATPISVDLKECWPRIQESTDVYIGPYAGEYKIRFELGWSDQNWQNFQESGILKNWEEVLTNRRVVSDWISFEIGPEFEEFASFNEPPKRILAEAPDDLIRFHEKRGGQIVKEWMIDKKTNLPRFIFTHDEPLETPLDWKQNQVLAITTRLKLEGYLLYSPVQEVSGDFAFFSILMREEERFQRFSGRFESGDFEGAVQFNYLFGYLTSVQVKGEFREGEMSGKWTQSDNPEFGEAMHGSSSFVFENGKLNGPFQECYPEVYGGRVFKEGNFTEDKIDGALTSFHPNGKLRSLEHFLPEYVTVRLDETNNAKRVLPMTSTGQVKHGEFSAYYEDGQLRHRYQFENNVPVGECEFHFRWNKKQFDTRGTFQDGTYFDGTFLSMTRTEHDSKVSRGLRWSQQYKYWILHYEKGRLKKEELIVDTEKDPLQVPTK